MKVIPSGVEEPRATTQRQVRGDLSTSLEMTDYLAIF